MDGVALTRLRWRLRGAWMWPSFIVLTLLDGLALHARPIVGDHDSFIAGWLLGFIDMPKVVARDYAGAGVIVAATLALLGGGLAHHHVVTADQAALTDATARAEAYIGDHAPARFISPLRSLDSYAVQSPTIYRICAAADQQSRNGANFYCVVVNRSAPFGRGVRYDGSESNALISEGTS
jgi:hypothetical protein